MSETSSTSDLPTPGAVPARWILPIWPATTPRGVNPEFWRLIQRRSAGYKPVGVPEDQVRTWSTFCLSVFAASQPRNITRVGDRMGALHRFLLASEARLDESVEEILSPERISRFLMSEHVTRLKPGGRQHVSRALTAATAALLGNPRSCPGPRSHPEVTALARIQELAVNPGRAQESARRVFAWLTNPNPSARIPRKHATRVSRALGSSGERVTQTVLQVVRLAILSCQPVTGFSLLKGNPVLVGFPYALAAQATSFDPRDARLDRATATEQSTSPEAS